ncbi:unnamed protein product [Leptosia nina]|uniref:Uncharacterized protein n=1 Tax=Leptosia nina TaxID=320188 RepID=A0AAV1JT27_9NEOP
MILNNNGLEIETVVEATCRFSAVQELLSRARIGMLGAARFVRQRGALERWTCSPVRTLRFHARLVPAELLEYLENVSEHVVQRTFSTLAADDLRSQLAVKKRGGACHVAIRSPPGAARDDSHANRI